MIAPMRKPTTICTDPHASAHSTGDVQVTAPNDIRDHTLVAEPGETKVWYRARQQLFSKILDRGGY